ncbi:putative membrane protein [Paramagnetospirillum magnetotacticum MS-1]|uniref:Probable membrane transporter protein n=1 Tax=Paramagnetospirillum magnetotacticum MS-1 TaxID=272627 RepID=A0A0C2YPX7_PARME|nr:sulfite exporter TauE/SafE family protein [Paramagnetospirillum magnetotacticum]KIL96705.1 putative membrane protein [Paramagnetospirillum magnetotacticum MS-1]
MSALDILLLVGSAFLAGAINSVAGGGTFLSFPALVFAGVPPVTANATNTVALFPGQLASAWAYRHDFPRVPGLNPKLIVAVSLAGGIAGAILLIYTPSRAFESVVPWLLLFATSIFAFSKRLIPWLKQRLHIGQTALYGTHFLLAVYGGYFGGAVGILMLALFGLFGIDDIHSANALKTLLSGLVNAIAVVCFVAAGAVAWTPALIMLASAVAGGYLGAHAAKRMSPGLVRNMVIAIGLVMTAAFFGRV